MNQREMLKLAKAQLEGGVLLDEFSTVCTCQWCDRDFHIKAEFDPCAFCDDCKSEVLDAFAEFIVLRDKAQRTARRVAKHHR